MAGVIAEWKDLNDRVRLLEAENAVLRHKAAFEGRAERTVVTVFGRTIPQLARDLDRLQRLDLAAKE